MLSSIKSLPSSSREGLQSLTDAMQQHAHQEKASFHTPGHKGFSWQADGSFACDSGLKEDLTELPGLDELSCPDGVIEDLEKRAAQVWGAESTLISVNGASAGIVASIIMLGKRGTHLLVPRNCHRSVVHGLVLSGLQPIWFEPEWDEEWDFWGAPSVASLESAIAGMQNTGGYNPPLRNTNSTAVVGVDGIDPRVGKNSNEMKIAGMVITSPTYAGALADIKAIAALAGKHNIPLIVDEAQGGHLTWSENHNQAALINGADIIIHSLHKTLSCPTQTGLVHLSKEAVARYGFSAGELRACMTLIQSSSPSYIFMSAIDKLVKALENRKAQPELNRVEKLCKTLQKSLSENRKITIYQPAGGSITTDILIKYKSHSPRELQELLIDQGVFPEAIIGEGLLFFLGIGSQQKDINILLAALDQICSEEKNGNTKMVKEINRKSKPAAIEQVLNLRKAFFAPSQVVPIQKALGQISAECRAPCPPGWPIIVPGQRVNKEILKFKEIESVRIVKSA